MMNVLPKRGESELDRMKRMGSLAMQRSKHDAEYFPIKIILKKNIPTRLGTFDLFVVLNDESNTTRPMDRISILRHDEKFYASPSYSSHGINFVFDDEGYNMFCFVPKTTHNMTMLASHYNELWNIEEEVIDREVAAVAKTLPQDREAHAHEPVDLTVVQRRETERAKEESELERLRRENEILRTVAGNVPKSEENKIENKLDQIKPDTNDLRQKAKTIMEERETPFLEKLKIKSKNFWLLPEYKQKLESIVDELRGVPV